MGWACEREPLWFAYRRYRAAQENAAAAAARGNGRADAAEDMPAAPSAPGPAGREC